MLPGLGRVGIAVRDMPSHWAGARILQNPWRPMLAVNAAVVIGVFIHKILLPPYVPYIHLLVDYRFGFIKRALIGAVVGLFTAKVPVWLVFALGGAVWLVTLGLFVLLFRKTFGFVDKNLPLLNFIAGSPFFFKNFMHSLGHFDIYGCVLVITLLLLPARSILYIVLAALFSVVLILIHHIHLLMYVPTIIVIVAIRHHLAHGCRPFRGWRQRSVFRGAILGDDADPGSRLRAVPAGQDGRSIPHQPPELQLHLVPATIEGNRGHLGAHAVEHSRRSRFRDAHLAAYAALALLREFDPSARK